MAKPIINNSALRLGIARHTLGINPEDALQNMMEHIRVGKELTEANQRRFQRIQKAWAMMSAGKAKQYIIDTLSKEYNVDDRTIRNDITDSYEVYGSFDLLEISGKLVARVNFYEQIAQAAFEAERFDEAVRASKQADMLLLEIQKQLAKKKVNPITRWTFKPVNAPEVIDIDYDLDE
jgi:hypothetical protein